MSDSEEEEESDASDSDSDSSGNEDAAGYAHTRRSHHFLPLNNHLCNLLAHILCAAAARTQTVSVAKLVGMWSSKRPVSCVRRHLV